MRILVIGMGNVGVMHGWVLSAAGVDGTHAVRRGSLAGHAQDIQTTGRRWSMKPVLMTAMIL